MPRLRNLNAREVIRILEILGFQVIRVKGSHYRLSIQVDDQTCFTTVPMHGSKPLSTATLKSIYRQAMGCISEDDLKAHFYTD